MRIFLTPNPLSGLIFILFFASLTLFPQILLAEEEKVIEKKAELEVLKKKIAVLQQVMRQRQSKLKKEDAVLLEVDQRINNINIKLRDLSSRKTELEVKLNASQDKKAITYKKLQQEQKVLAEQLRSAYVSGHEEYIKLIMNQQDPSVISRMLVYYRYLAESRVRTINTINHLIKKIKKLEQGINARGLELDAIIAAQQLRWQSLKIAYQEQQKAVIALRDELTGNAQQIARMESDEQELVNLIDKLSDIIDELQEEERTATSFKSMRGKLELPADAKVAIRFGSRRQIGAMRWKGIILSGKLGSDVHAVFGGRVVYADWMRGFGLLLIIDHGDSYLSLYGHNESVLVEEGDWVEKGQVVSSMGKSGGSSKSGLYFAIRYKGRAQNPLKWVKR